MKLFRTQIITPTGRIYDGESGGLQMPGVNGKFEVKYQHASLVALLVEGTARLIKPDKTVEIYEIGRGFVEVHNNNVILMTESAEIKEVIED